MRFQFGGRPSADILVLLDSCIRRRAELEWICSMWKHVIVIPGPYECERKEEIRRICNDNTLILLDNRTVHLGVAVFVGSPMWPSSRNKYWNEDDCERIMQELSIHAGSDPVVVFSYFRPEDEFMKKVAMAGRAPRAWFHASDEPRPISGTTHGIFTYGYCADCPESGIPFSYLPLQ